MTIDTKMIRRAWGDHPWTEELCAEVDRLRAAITQALGLIENDAPDMAIVTLREAIGIGVGP